MERPEVITVDGKQIAIDSVYAIYGAEDTYLRQENNHYVSIFTKQGSVKVYAERSEQETGERVVIMSHNLKKMDIDNFAFVNGYLINIDNTRYVDVERDPSGTRRVHAVFDGGKRMAISEEVSLAGSKEADEMIASYDAQKSAIISARPAVEETPAQAPKVQ